MKRLPKRKLQKTSDDIELKFLNVDLEIHTRSKMDRFMEEVRDDTLLLYSGREWRKNYFSLLLENLRSFRNPDAAINAFYKLILGLSRSARAEWKAAEKEFDSGFQPPPSKCIHCRISDKALQQIAELGATFSVTLYQDL